MSEGKIKVAVSPFYQGFGWRDVALNKDFKPQPRLIPIVISNDEDLSEVVRRVRLNHLVLLEGVLPDVGQPEDKDELIESQKAEITSLKSTNQTLQSEKEGLQSENQTLKTTNQGLVSTNQTLESEKTTLQSAKEALELEKTTLQSEKEALELENTALKQEIEDLKAAVPEEMQDESDIQMMSSEEEYRQEELETMTVTELKALLDAREIDYTTTMKKDDLINLLIGQIK